MLNIVELLVILALIHPHRPHKMPTRHSVNSSKSMTPLPSMSASCQKRFKRLRGKSDLPRAIYSISGEMMPLYNVVCVDDVECVIIRYTPMEHIIDHC